MPDILQFIKGSCEFAVALNGSPQALQINGRNNPK